MKSTLHAAFLVATFFTIVIATGCVPRSENEVVVYCALDREFSESILKEFESTSESSIAVSAKYDVESTKTVGLVTAIINEKNRPRCDLFWNNEILHTIRLKNLGLLDSYVCPSAENFPDDYRSPQSDWYGFAARARILVVNKELLPNNGERPQSVLELADPKWKGKVAMAKPLFGTTATHAAVLYSRWGDEKARKFFESVKQNVAVQSGNKQVALSVASGEFAWGITDTDDAIVEIEKGRPIEIVFPDQKPIADREDPIGTLFIPNTLCLIKDSGNPENARRLMDFLLTSSVEEKLSEGASAQFPVNKKAQQKSRIAMPENAVWMPVDFEEAADKWDAAARDLREIFQTSD